MKWAWWRRIFVMCGILLVISLIPHQWRPTWVSTPMRKADQTIYVQGGDPNLASHIKHACEPALLLRPLEKRSNTVHVVTLSGAQAAAVKDYNCEAYK